MVCQFCNRSKTEKRRGAFHRMESPKGGVERHNILGVSVEAQQSCFNMLTMITALLDKITDQLTVDTRRKRTQPVWGYLSIIHKHHIP